MEEKSSIGDFVWQFLGVAQSSTLILLVGVTVAIISILSHRRTERKKETHQLMFNSSSDDRLIQGLDKFEQLHDSEDQNIRLYATTRKDDDEAAMLRYVLNYWERIAVGIQEGSYCERILKKSHYSTFLSLYNQASPLILAIREATGKNTYFQEIEWLHKKWKRKPLKQRSN